VIVFGLVVAAAFVIPASKLASSLPLQVREEAALQFLALGDVFWPVFLSLIVGAVIFSVSLARRIAGPMDRLQTFCDGLADGDLSSRVRLRSSDELRPLSLLINRSLDRLEGGLLEAREQQIGAQDALEAALDSLRSEGALDRPGLEQLEEAMKRTCQLAEVLGRFRLSDPGGGTDPGGSV
jgi:methyl-accepting chemotaxis protein